jgi:hypothetical protein
LWRWILPKPGAIAFGDGADLPFNRKVVVLVFGRRIGEIGGHIVERV